MSKLLKVKQVAEQLGYSPSGIYKLAKASKIPHIKIPSGGLRFNPDVLESWLKKRTVKVKS
jgi:excisionase family DNA binding protein